MFCTTRTAVDNLREQGGSPIQPLDKVPHMGSPGNRQWGRMDEGSPIPMAKARMKVAPEVTAANVGLFSLPRLKRCGWLQRMSHVQTTYEATCHVFRTSQIISVAQYNQGCPASSQHRLDVLACKIQGPCLHLRARESVDQLTDEAAKRLVDDFQTLSIFLTD